jgi:hypothetical protein
MVHESLQVIHVQASVLTSGHAHILVVLDISDGVFYGAQYYHILPFEKDSYVIKKPILKDSTFEISSKLPVF